MLPCTLILLLIKVILFPKLIRNKSIKRNKRDQILLKTKWMVFQFHILNKNSCNNKTKPNNHITHQYKIKKIQRVKTKRIRFQMSLSHNQKRRRLLKLNLTLKDGLELQEMKLNDHLSSMLILVKSQWKLML